MKFSSVGVVIGVTPVPLRLRADKILFKMELKIKGEGFLKKLKLM